MTITISSLQDLHDFAQKLQTQGLTNFLLKGNLWVGKTQFVKEFVSVLGGDKHQVQSPTYTYINTYSTPHWEVLHIDMYRLDSAQDTLDRGIFEAIDNHDIVFIEWPRREEEYIDPSWTQLEFEVWLWDERILRIS